MKERHVPASLRRARGLGASGTGTEHWWLQRLTAVANIVLVCALLIVLLMQVGKEYAEVRAGLSGLLPTLVLTLFVAVTFFHAALGMQVVIEDYVHHHPTHLAVLIGIRFVLVVLALTAILMILRNFFGA